QLLEALDLLRAAGMDECLELLHFHMGSQISNLADIQLGVAEAGRYFQELGKLGVRPRIIDVGGGLAVDYEGAGSRGYFSMNYHVEQYAAAIVEAIGQACDAEGLPHPDLMTESGRALTAHHAVLVAEVTAEETPPRQVLPPGAEPEHASVAGLRSVLDELDDREPRAQFEQARYYFSDVKEKFVHGLVSLGERAAAESVFFAICEAVQNALHVDVPGDRELGDELRRLLADKYFCNFSIFRSLPDIWAIDQVFPILPVSGHGSRPEHRAIIEDLTCDSDGRIDQYVEADGVDATLPVHGYDPDARYLLAVFLVGAYQEILGDDHNLFGRTHSLDLTCSQDGWTLHNPVRGDDAAAVLADVGFQRDRLLGALEERIVGAALDADRRRTFLEAVHHSLDAYTYLTTDDVEKD
ncbi:MAG: biosynthetic arginine decarboxylase, partial [Pseudomonadota bacterium]